MKPEQKKEALENALMIFNFPKRYFLYTVNKGANTKFILASKSDDGGLNTHSIAMSYDEFNFYLKGWYDAKTNKF